MPESDELRRFVAVVEREVLDLQGRPPAWTRQGVLAGRAGSLEREERGARRERRVAGEQLRRKREVADTLERGTGETWLRERLSATPWGVPKEVWRARRDREREVLDAEDALLDERAAARDEYLADLRALEPGERWRDTPPDEETSLEVVDRLWRERRRAVTAAAELLLARPSVRAALRAAWPEGESGASEVARAATPALWALEEVPRVAALVAALALLAAREGPAALGSSAGADANG